MKASLVEGYIWLVIIMTVFVVMAANFGSLSGDPVATLTTPEQAAVGAGMGALLVMFSLIGLGLIRLGNIIMGLFKKG